MKKINSYFLITRKKIPAYLKYYWSKITPEIKTKVEGIPPLILLKSLGKNLINYLIYGNSVQDGTPTPSNPIEIESVGDLITDTNDINYGKYKIPVIAKSKNLFDDTTLSNKWVNISGSIVDLPKANCKRFECVEGETYTLSASYETKTASNIIVMAFYDINDTLLIRNTVSNLEYEELIKTAPQNSKYFYAGYYTIEPQTIQLEKSDIATEYEPYVQPTTTNIYLDEPLRKVGDFADYIDFANGKIVRNINKIFLSNSDGMVLYSYQNLHGVYFRFKLDGNYNRANGLSNYENQIGAYYGNTGTYMWLGNNSPTVYWVGVLDSLGIYDANKTDQEMISELKTWLTQNTVYIYYPLNTAIEETILLPNIPTIKGTTIFEIDTEIQPSKIEVEYLRGG